MMNQEDLQRELKVLYSLFSKNEERVNQLTRRENYLRTKLREESKH